MGELAQALQAEKREAWVAMDLPEGLSPFGLQNRLKKAFWGSEFENVGDRAAKQALPRPPAAV